MPDEPEITTDVSVIDHDYKFADTEMYADIEDFHTIFGPYATAIGFFIYEWNHLQDSLCGLYCNLVKGETHVSQAIWHAVPHDRTQRLMLLAAAQAYFEPKTAILDEITWLLKMLHTFGDQRDNIVHSPLSMRVGEPIEFVPRWFFGHERAKKLKKELHDQKLLDELHRYHAKAKALGIYARDLNAYVLNCGRDGHNPLRPLPKRPTWPSHRRKTAEANQRQSKRVK